jgi:hypothetical protein
MWKSSTGEGARRISLSKGEKERRQNMLRQRGTLFRRALFHRERLPEGLTSVVFQGALIESHILANRQVPVLGMKTGCIDVSVRSLEDHP